MTMKMKQQTQFTTLINFLMVLCSFGITAKGIGGDDTQFSKSSNGLDDPYQGDLVIKKLYLLITHNIKIYR